MKPAALIRIRDGKQTCDLAGTPAEVVGAFKAARESVAAGEYLYAIGARGILKRCKGKEAVMATEPAAKKARAKKMADG